MKLVTQLRHLIADNSNPRSLASRMRWRRYRRLQRLLALRDRDLILDIGAGSGYGLEVFNQVNPIITLNLTLDEARAMLGYRNVTPVVGDGCRLPFHDRSVDLAFSNSVIEHIPDEDQMRRLADEHIRVGRRYYLQTPNRRFPLEPHYLFPFFQYLPAALQRRIHQIWWPGWLYGQAFEQVRLLTRRDLRRFFPRARVVPERLLGMTKSWMVVGGDEHAGP